MRRALALAICVLLSAICASCQSYAGNRAQTISNIFQASDIQSGMDGPPGVRLEETDPKGINGWIKKLSFTIPIQTLTAISNFAQNTRPLGEIIQRRRNPQVQSMYTPTSGQSTPIISYPRSNAAKIAGLYTASDGSGFRI